MRCNAIEGLVSEANEVTEEAVDAPSSTATLMMKVPGDGATVTIYYKQNIYDPLDSKIGEYLN